jgi:valyl-tRNA synthetase
MKLSKSYEPAQYESDIYSLWEQSDAFAPKEKGANGYFSLVVPPPNANAPLHIGFGLTMAIEDIIARYNRLKNKAVEFIPGADHAGFETWVVYEKQLSKKGKTRFDYSREELYSQVWDFVATNKKSFEEQFRRLGASVNWASFTFTLDDKIVDRAYKTFKQLWDDKLIYRGERLVNYCTYHDTSFADVEVEYKDEEGKLWYINYPLTEGEGYLTVATTRPETLLGDTAVAVNPHDNRYNKYIGKTVKLPLTKREIPIIADEMVDMQFGTGAVKITPAHDFNDFEVAQRHDLPKMTVIDFKGNMTHDTPIKYRGLNSITARGKIVEDLKEQGLLVKEVKHRHSVGHCYKCGTVIEPLLKEQWFVEMKPLALTAIKALKENKIKFYPASKKQQLINYLEGLRDWNISRQIAWGIPIPAFQNVDDPDDWIFDTRIDEETIAINDKTYHRDPDVFDTWFSSGSWPYATLDFPGEKFKKYYPLSVMETGGEILYQWVSRMLMLGLYVTKEIPFESVYIHGYVMAEDGTKMSKSIGNVVNITEVINQYGSDAFRMGIIAGRTPATNRGYDKAKVEGARNFCNKIWNIARYCEGVAGDNVKEVGRPKPKSNADHWLLSKLHQYTEEIALDFDKYKIAEAYEKLYRFVWDDFADWYIETSKVEMNSELLVFALEAMLIMAHPFAPFVTETIWQTLHPDKDSLLTNQLWPKIPSYNKKAACEFEDIIKIVSEVRYITTVLDVKYPGLYFKKQPFLSDNCKLLKRLAKLGHCKEVEAGRGMHLTQTKIDCWLDIDLNTTKKYVTKLRVNKLEKEAIVEKLQQRLQNKAYILKAPHEIVKQTKEQLTEEQGLLAKLEQELQNFQTATDSIN